MVEEKLVSLDTVYTDGTKIESAANRYTFVWGKAMQTSIGRIADQINELWAYADTGTYKQHMDTFKEMYGTYPSTAVADAGYGSEENYVYAREKGMTTFIKYNYFHKEQAKSWKDDPFRSSNFQYNPQQNCFYCPMGQVMRHIEDRKQNTTNGFEQTISRYQAQNCEGCPLRGGCHKAEGNRIIEVNHNLNKLRNKEREKLMSEDGLRHRSQRPQDVEATFGNLKSNKGFKRFRLRGLKKVETEFGLLALAHNLAKIA